MKTITIPKRFGYPTTEIISNGKHYTLKSGEEISVDDHLAEIIENAIALAPKYGRNISRFAQFVEGGITEINEEELEGITVISPCAFYNYDNLISIVIPDSVTNIDYSAFGNCDRLADVTIGGGVTSIGANAFEYCTSLESIEITNNVNSIGSHAFRECTKLKKVIVRPVIPPSIKANTFLNVPTTCVFEVPAESLEAYKSAPYWSAIANQIVAIKE